MTRERNLDTANSSEEITSNNSELGTIENNLIISSQFSHITEINKTKSFSSKINQEKETTQGSPRLK